MVRGTEISKLCRTRELKHRAEARNDARARSDAIKRSADPLSEEDAQRPYMIPRNHFPCDVWQLIIDQITDPQEIVKLWELCPLFRQNLSYGRKYIQARLPQIIQIILEKRPSVLVENEDDPENEEDPPSQSVNPWNKIMMNLRMVSWICNKSVEELLEAVDGSKFYTKLEEMGKVETIREAVLGNEVKTNAFIFHRMQVDEQNINDVQRDAFAEAVGIFLELVGEHVRTLKYVSKERPQAAYDRLKSMVMYLPNLENLELSTEFDLATLRADDVDIPAFGDLQAFPICPQLKSFTQIKQCLPKEYLRHIIEASPNILSFLVQPYWWKDNERQGLLNTSEMNLRLQHLERLRTVLYPSLLRTCGFRLPLKEIVLTQIYEGRGRRPTAARVFTLLNQFSETLEHLELWIVMQHSDGCFLNLPRLKVFKWRHHKSFHDLCFLQHAGNLEYIEMDVSDWGDDRQSFFNRFINGVYEGFDYFRMRQVWPRLKKPYITFVMDEH